MTPDSLRSRLTYEPRELQFGTSGRRGEVVHLSQLEIYTNVTGELEYLQSLPATEGGIARGDVFYFAHDLRPSSVAFVAGQGGRGELCQTVERAVRDAGMQPVNLGCIPTPALMYFAAGRGKGSIMVTGSHIPFDRNGYKLNTSRGELLKHHEAPINTAVARVRARLYEQPFAGSIFDERGFFRSGHAEIAPATDEARLHYFQRYTGFFAGEPLAGLRLLLYEHSAVGRELLAETLRALGAEVVTDGRSETFVPIDTENIDAETLAAVQVLADRHPGIDAVVSTDGDSDRPLLLAPEGNTGRLHFFGGDLVGMVVAEYLHADAVVVPITCNDAIDRGVLAPVVQPKTRIGSPFVIAGMLKVPRPSGSQAPVVCGWEANGGFLLGSEIHCDGRTLTALPTRDAFLPIVAALCAARGKSASLSEVFAALPKRFSRAALLRNFPRATALRIVERFSPPHDAGAIRTDLAAFFPGFGPIARLDYTDGVRLIFENGDVAHFRPSGNADEFRIYGCADTQQRADEITALGVAEPDGILRSMERRLS